MDTPADHRRLRPAFGPFRLLLQVIAIAALASSLGACAVGPRQVWQQFTFSGDFDGWDRTIDLLAYEYGTKERMTKNSVDKPRGPVWKDGSSIAPTTNINGPMPVGEFLYVRWRVKATGQVYEERVDLRERLPADMKDHGLTFVIDGPRLYVYVITPRPEPYYEAPPLNRSWHSKSYVTYEIFPTLTKP